MRIDKVWIGLIAMAALSGAAGLARAQQGPPPPPPGPDGGFIAFGAGPGMGPGEPMTFVGIEEGVGGKTVTGAPFTATFSTKTTETLADGNQIQRSATGSFARDSQGRTHRDLTLPSIGPWAASGKAAPHVVFINDVIAGTQYVLDPDRKIARTVSPRGKHGHEQGGPSADGQGAPPGGPEGWRNRKDVVTTSLGTQMINGVPAEGTRYTRTIPAGAIGNQNPIVITTERWYSPDLQTVVLTKHSDPRMGETVTELTNIQRGEPDAALFQVPSDYTVKQGGPDGLHRRNRPPQ